MALAANDHEKDGDFFAKEMIAKRGVETTGFWGLLFNSLYWKLSYYGQSFVRPLVGLGASLVGFAAANAGVVLLSAPALFARPFEILGFAIVYSLRSVAPFVGALVRAAPAPEDYGGWFAGMLADLETAGAWIDALIVLSVVQQILGLALVFFLLLGLRNQFRLR